MDRTIAVVYLCLIAAVVGWYVGRSFMRRDDEASQLRRSIWSLEAKEREREWIAAGKPEPGPYAPGPFGVQSIK